MRAVRYLITGGSGYIGSRLTDEPLPRATRPRRSSTSTFARRRAHGPRRVRQGRRPGSRSRCAICSSATRSTRSSTSRSSSTRSATRRGCTTSTSTGPQAVLRAAAEAGTKQVMVTSSATAYGAFPDNPKPIAEDWPVRGVSPTSPTRMHKADADRVCQLWALRAPRRGDDDRPAVASSSARTSTTTSRAPGRTRPSSRSSTASTRSSSLCTRTTSSAR